MSKLAEPTTKLVDEYIDKFNKEKRYFASDNAIINLLEQFPENKKIEDIILKISTINNLYSTNIYGTFKMAEHILSLDIDKKLNEGNLDVVNQILQGHNIRSSKTGKEIHFYSFATKYCNWHNKDAYAIYDSFVEKILIAYRNELGFPKFKNSGLKDYSHFVEIVKELRDKHSLTKYNFKEIDKFLWKYGKENFNN